MATGDTGERLSKGRGRAVKRVMGGKRREVKGPAGSEDRARSVLPAVTKGAGMKSAGPQPGATIEAAIEEARKHGRKMENQLAGSADATPDKIAFTLADIVTGKVKRGRPRKAPIEAEQYQTAVRMPLPLVAAIDRAMADDAAVMTSRAEFIRRAIENELKARGVLKSYRRG